MTVLVIILAVILFVVWSLFLALISFNSGKESVKTDMIYHGPRGPEGPQGETGLMGNTGPQGPPGECEHKDLWDGLNTRLAGLEARTKAGRMDNR